MMKPQQMPVFKELEEKKVSLKKRIAQKQKQYIALYEKFHSMDKDTQIFEELLVDAPKRHEATYERRNRLAEINSVKADIKNLQKQLSDIHNERVRAYESIKRAHENYIYFIEKSRIDFERDLSVANRQIKHLGQQEVILDFYGNDITDERIAIPINNRERLLNKYNYSLQEVKAHYKGLTGEDPGFTLPDYAYYESLLDE